MASPVKKDHVANFYFEHSDLAGRRIAEHVTVDKKGHVTCYSTRFGNPDEFKYIKLGQEGRGLFEFMMQRLPILFALILTIFNIFTVAVALALALTWNLWQVFPNTSVGYDMSMGPDYRPLTWTSVLGFCLMGAVALCDYWLEATPTFLGFKPITRGPRRPCLLWMNRIVLGLNGLWSFYVFIACPIAYSVTWKLDRSADLCAAGSTGVATCGVNGCTCSGLMDMSCTPAPLCRALGSDQEVSGAHLPLLVGAIGASILGIFLGLMWIVNMIVIYGTWTVESAEARRLARKNAEVEHHRFTVLFRGQRKIIFTLSAEEDPDEVISCLMPELGSPSGSCKDFRRPGFLLRRGFVSRFNTPVKDSRSVNVDLYDEVFRPVGVSMMQYERLMSFANKCKATPGSVVVPGGKSNGRFVLLTYGAAVAHKHGPESPEKLGDPICVYLGRLTPRQSLSPQLLEKGPVRGSVVGGSALVDGSVTEKVYPSDIVAAEPTEWLEWDLDEAQPEAAEPAPVALLFFIAVPFFGFGFADNAIMIVCGDFIDAQFGVMFGLTTMASAGLGNWLSDTIGLGLGDVIERSAAKMGLSNGGLSSLSKTIQSSAQHCACKERMQIAKMTTLGGKLIGITLGCFAGARASRSITLRQGLRVVCCGKMKSQACLM
eukprot:g30673.t1